MQDQDNIVSTLANALGSNIGNRLTAELANGIILAVNHAREAARKDTPAQGEAGESGHECQSDPSSPALA